MRTITINPHHCSKEEYQELIDYLEVNCWSFSLEDSNADTQKGFFWNLSDHNDLPEEISEALDEAADERIQYYLANGYISGELIFNGEDEDGNIYYITGWWNK